MSGVPISLGRTVRRAPSGPPLPWAEAARLAPELTYRVAARLTAHKHHVLATLTASGAPRVSGTEVAWWEGELWIGSMRGSRKAEDLQADPRFALHSNPGNGSMRGGDAKISGHAIEVTDAQVLDPFLAAHDLSEPMHLFFLRVQAVTLTEVTTDGAALAITTWRSGEAVTTIRRT